MTAAVGPAAHIPAGGPEAELTWLLGNRPAGDLVAVCHLGKSGWFRPRVLPVRDAARHAGRVWRSDGGSDVWVGIASLDRSLLGSGGRGASPDIRGLRVLPIDLDVKPGGLPSWEAAEAVVEELSTLLKVKPYALVNSGHGLQPWFILDAGDPAWNCDGPDDPRHAAMVAALRRWGRLVADVAAQHGGGVDGVFEVTRLMRCPSTVNYKDRALPVGTAVVEWEDQHPIRFEHLRAVLHDYGVESLPEDAVTAGEIVLPVVQWNWAPSTCNYAKAMVEGWGTDSPGRVDGQPGPRHAWLLAQSVRLAAAHRHGCLTETDHVHAVSTLTRRFVEIVRDPLLGAPRPLAVAEIPDAIAWGTRLVEGKDRAEVAAELGQHEHPGSTFGELAGVDPATGIPRSLEDRVFEATPQLAYVRRLAHARLVSPWSVLAGRIAIALAEAPTTLRIPAFVGTAASLNSFFALVGRSGSGKSEAVSVALESHGPVDAATRNPSSGEGIISLFVSTSANGEQTQHTTNVLSVVDEVASLGAQQERKGSTLGSILRSAWSGKMLSTHAAERSRQRHLDAHSYRFVMVMGVQPITAGMLLNDGGAGTPQRIVWVPAEYADFPDSDIPVGDHPFVRAELGDGPHLIEYPPYVAQLVRDAKKARTAGDPAALDGHALLSRLKVAAGLALMHGTTVVDHLLWEVSGALMQVSDATRAKLVEGLSAQRRWQQTARGQAEALREEAKQDHQLERAVRVLVTYVTRNPEGVTRRQVKDALGRHKKAATEAIQAAVDGGLVREVREEGTNGSPAHSYYPVTKKP